MYRSSASIAKNLLYSSANYIMWSKIREGAGQQPRVGRGQHQRLGVLLVSVFLIRLVSKTGLCCFWGR